MDKVWRSVLLAGGLLLAPWQGATADPIWTFETIPASGDVTGEPGDTVGWGYTIANLDATHFLVASGLDAGGFVFAVPNALGIFDFPIVPPNTTATVPYALGVGLFEVTIDANAPPGSVDLGTFVVHVDWFNGDPTDAASQIVLADQTLEGPYSLTVTAPPGTVPAGATGWLMTSGLVALAALRTRRGPQASRERRRSMSTTIRLAVILLVALALPSVVCHEVEAAGGLLPTIPEGWVFNASKDVSAVIVLDPNGPVFAPPAATPTGTFGTVAITRKHHPDSVAVFQVQPGSTLSELTFGCNLLLTNTRFLELSPNPRGLPLGGPGVAANWLPSSTTITLFEQVGVPLVDQSFTILMIPGVSRIRSQRCTPFPSTYPDLSFQSGSTPETQWRPGFLILEVDIGFWAAPGTKTPK